MQTWLVHMRQPTKLWRELGAAGFLGFQVMVGGTVLSALVHPWFYALAAFDLANHAFLTKPGVLGFPLWLKQVPLMPLYWLLISGAAYRAIWQFMTGRFGWVKTEHGVSASMAKAAPL